LGLKVSVDQGGGEGIERALESRVGNEPAVARWRVAG
jgi:hypothetical protein